MRHESLEKRDLLAVTVSIDYSYDSHGFFDSVERRDSLQSALDSVVSQLSDTLQSISPRKRNNWRAHFIDPSTGSDTFVLNQKIESNQLVVYAGGRDLGSSLGEGGPGGYTASGNGKWIKRVETRGEGQPAPWGGSLAFNTDIPWHFGETTSGLTMSRFDFRSVAVHEMTHLLGFGASAVFDAQVVDGMFAGQNAASEFGGPVPLSPSWGHWSPNLVDSAMDSRLSSGKREPLSRLDRAALVDIGWEIDLSSQPLSSSVRTPRAAA